MSEEISISKEEKELFKQQLATVLGLVKQAKTEKVDTPENLKEAEALVKSAGKCIGGTFKSYINADNVDKLEEKIKNNKNKSTFVTKITKWVKKFVDLCRNPNSVNKEEALQKETDVLINGSKITKLAARPLSKDVQKATEELRNTVHPNKINNELKAKFKTQTEAKQPEKKNDLKRSKPVSKEQKDNWRKHTAGRNI